MKLHLARSLDKNIRSALISDNSMMGEADAWFHRNRSALTPNKVRHRSDVVDLVNFIGSNQSLSGKASGDSRFLEVGCSNGVVLEALGEATPAQLVGIDPSEKAILEGQERLQASQSRFDLRVSEGQQIPFDDAEFNFVLAGFFLYLVPPKHLLGVLAELDRVTKPGGFLTITDFDHPRPMSVPYHHQPKSKVHKRNYAAILLSTQHYSLVFSRSYTNGSSLFSEDPNLRQSTTILYKEPHPYMEFTE